MLINYSMKTRLNYFEDSKPLKNCSILSFSSASISSSIIPRSASSPLSTLDTPEMDTDTRWSVTLSCGKLYVRILSDRSPVP